MATQPEYTRRHSPATSSCDPSFITNRDSSETAPQAIDSGMGLPVLSLFSGAGGLDLGFQNAGFQPRLAIDINPTAVKTYQKNNPGTTAVAMDLSATSPSDLADLWETCCPGVTPIGIIGGPPCQGYSPSNVHQTEDDPRRQLLFNYADTVTAFKDRFGIDFFVLENVPGLLHKRHCALFNEFVEQCDRAGFEVWDATLDAGTFGIAQHRERLVVVGINRQRHPLAELDLSAGDQVPLNVSDVLKGLPEPAYCARDLETGSIPYHQNHVAMVPRSKKFTDGSLTRGKQRGTEFQGLGLGCTQLHRRIRPQRGARAPRMPPPFVHLRGYAVARIPSARLLSPRDLYGASSANFQRCPRRHLAKELQTQSSPLSGTSNPPPSRPTRRAPLWRT